MSRVKLVGDLFDLSQLLLRDACYAIFITMNFMTEG